MDLHVKEEIALGQNVLIAYMPWEGYNYEDAILVSERMVTDDLYTSVHIEKYEIEARQTKLGPEEITREIPNISEESLNNLDEMELLELVLLSRWRYSCGKSYSKRGIRSTT